MIGKLKKDNNQFFIEYKNSVISDDIEIKILPIHPNDLVIVDTEHNNHCINSNVSPIIIFSTDEMLSPDGVTYYEVARVIQDKVDNSWEEIYERYKRNKGKKSFYEWIKTNYTIPNKK